MVLTNFGAFVRNREIGVVSLVALCGDCARLSLGDCADRPTAGRGRPDSSETRGGVEPCSDGGLN